MISVVARKTTDSSVNSLSVCVKNRLLGINTYISMKLRIKAREWSNEMQMPRHMTDQRPVAELRGMSYSELAEKVMAIKKDLSAAEDCGKLTIEYAKATVSRILNEEFVKEMEEIAERQAEKEKQSGRMTLQQWIAEFIRQCETGERLKRKSTRMVTEGTIKSYKGTLTQLEEYEKAAHKRIDFDDVTLDFYESWRQYFIKKKYSPNTIGRHVKNLKIFLYAAEDMKLTTCLDFKSARFSADHEDVENIYIPVDRLKQMAAFDMSDYKTMKAKAEQYAKDDEEKKSLLHALRRDIFRKNLGEARDIFLLGCLTGQRVSDYKRISKDMVETIVGSRKFLHLVQVKTGKDVYVPYTDMIDDILQRYVNGLPHVADQHLNERIKIVGLLLGWTESAGLNERKGLMEYRSNKRFCDAIKTHTARRTFATNAYKAGVPLSSIMAVTGHASEQMLRKYLKLDSKERALLAATDFDNIMKEAK